MISIIIPTYNRFDSLYLAITSILASKYQNYELILIDQNLHGIPQKYIPIDPKKRIRIIRTSIANKSRAICLGLSASKGDYVAFTDDDCIVTSNWLSIIDKVFSQNVTISGIFGSTLPYHPAAHKNLICMCTHIVPYVHIVSKPIYHADAIGYGNNMAFRKRIVGDIDAFRTWLGPGSIGLAAEDAEFVLRALLLGYKIIRDPNLIIYHNKWLSSKQQQALQLSYTCGEMACYGYFLFQGYSFARPIIKNNIFDSYYKLRKLFRSFILLKWDIVFITDIGNFFQEILYRTRGLLVGLWFSMIDPILKFQS